MVRGVHRAPTPPGRSCSIFLKTHRTPPTKRSAPAPAARSAFCGFSLLLLDVRSGNLKVRKLLGPSLPISLPISLLRIGSLVSGEMVVEISRVAHMEWCGAAARAQLAQAGAVPSWLRALPPRPAPVQSPALAVQSPRDPAPRHRHRVTRAPGPTLSPTQSGLLARALPSARGARYARAEHGTDSTRVRRAGTIIGWLGGAGTGTYT